MPIKGIVEGKYNLREYLAFVGASVLEDSKSVFVGTGLPIIATMLAQKTHAPSLLIIFEGGGMGPLLPDLPVSVGESRTYYKGIAASSMHDVMSLSQAGYIDYGFLGAAQMDMYGNINTTIIGDHDMPKVRLPGSGGANDVVSFCQKTIIILRQSKRRFPEKVDFITCPGYLDGRPGQREEVGLIPGTGPRMVITNLGIYEFEDREMVLKSVHTHTGVTLEQVKAEVDWDIKISPNLEDTAPPTEEELRILREKVDPGGKWVGGKSAMRRQDKQEDTS